jgi:hypothetical protein
MTNILAQSIPIYKKLKKPSPRLRPIPDQGEAPKKTTFIDPPTVTPLHTLQPREEYDGDTLIPQEYLDKQAILDQIDDLRVKCDYHNHNIESQVRARRAAEGPSGKSRTSSTSYNPPQTTKNSSSILVSLSQHLHGELPTYQPKPIQQIDLETVLIFTVLDSQQQPLPTQEIASELCTAIIVSEIQHQPNSPSHTAFDTTASEQVVSEDQTTTTAQTEPPFNQTVSDTSSVLEDQAFMFNLCTLLNLKQSFIITTFMIVVQCLGNHHLLGSNLF